MIQAGDKQIGREEAGNVAKETKMLEIRESREETVCAAKSGGESEDHRPSGKSGVLAAL